MTVFPNHCGMNDRGREGEGDGGAPRHGMPNWKKLKEEEATPLWAPFHSAVYDGDVGRGFILPLYGRRRGASQVNQKRICGCPLS